MTDAPKKQIARKGRRIGLLLAIIALLWLGVQIFNAEKAIGFRALILIDLAAMAGFIFCLLNAFWLWQARRKEKDAER